MKVAASKPTQELNSLLSLVPLKCYVLQVCLSIMYFLLHCRRLKVDAALILVLICSSEEAWKVHQLRKCFMAAFSDSKLLLWLITRREDFCLPAQYQRFI